MKALLLVFLISFSFSSWARPCVVYGITDSPQKLDCQLGKKAVNLRCVNGNYQLSGSPVANAFHMEVEEGAVPLVFEASKTKLTVLIHSPSNIEAEWEEGSTTLTGRCRL